LTEPANSVGNREAGTGTLGLHAISVGVRLNFSNHDQKLFWICKTKSFQIPQNNPIQNRVNIQDGVANIFFVLFFPKFIFWFGNSHSSKIDLKNFVL
jgi:hypothetical protein